jgi:hypothetical protein
MSQVPRVTTARYGNSNNTHSGLHCGCVRCGYCGGYHNGSDAATPTAGGTAATNAHAASGSADEAPIEPEY